MEIQQELASKEAFKESLLKQIAINTGSNLSDLRSDSHQENRTERVNNVIGPLPDFPSWASFDMAKDDDDDDTPYDTPFNTPARPTADYSDRVNRSLDMEEQEEINKINKQEQQKELIRKQTSQHLEDLQPKRHIDVDTKVLTRNYLNRIYESVSEKERAEEDGKLVRQELYRDERAEQKERKREEKARQRENRREKASGSKDVRTYEDENPESAVEPKGNPGRPKKSPIPQSIRDMKVRSQLQKEKDDLIIQESNLNSPSKSTLQGKHLTTIVNEYNWRTWSQVTTRKVKRHTKAFDGEGNEITKAAMIDVIIDQNKTMSKQALRT